MEECHFKTLQIVKKLYLDPQPPSFVHMPEQMIKMVTYRNVTS